ncbi:MAG: hypothetical protein NC086_01060 [Alistipes sp.]|nr:hypothetical protein [Alistipes sp.]
MKFKHVAMLYVVIGFLVIAGICIWEWNALKDFQFSYDDEENRKSIFADMREEYRRETTADAAKEQETTQPAPEDVIQPSQTAAEGKKEHDLIIADMAQLLGVEAEQIQGTPVEDEALSKTAVYCLELYLKHINGMASLSDLQSIMRTDSKAYKAILSSQQSLEWLIKSKSITFTKEETEDMVRFDENHFACDVAIELTKVPDTERERTVEESVRYRILFENVNGNWCMYSFMTK